MNRKKGGPAEVLEEFLQSGRDCAMVVLGEEDRYKNLRSFRTSLKFVIRINGLQCDAIQRDGTVYLVRKDDLQ